MRKVTLLLLSLAVLGGCQKGDTSDKVVLSFTYWGSPIEKRAIEEALSSFEESYHGVEVKAQHIPDSAYAEKLSTMVAGGTEPDVAYLGVDQSITWAQKGLIHNIYEFLDEDDELNREDYIDGIFYEWEEGKTVGTNTALEATALFYNKALFDKAGLAYPPSRAEEAWSWDEFVNRAKQLTVDQQGNNGLSAEFDPKKIVQYGVAINLKYRYMPFVYGNGGRYISEDRSQFRLDSPEATEALQRLADLVWVHHVAPTPAAQKTLPSEAMALQTGQVAMSYTGQWVLLDLANGGFDFGIGVIPKQREVITFYLGAPTVIFSKTEHPQEAWLLFKWLANPETSLVLHREGLWMPLLKRWYTDPNLLAKWAKGNPAHPPEYKEAIIDLFLSGKGRPDPAYLYPDTLRLNQVILPTLETIWEGKVTAEQGLSSIADTVNQIIEEKRE